MIVAFLAFGFALVQVLIYQGILSLRDERIYNFVLTALSGIPLAFQLLLVVGELTRARKYIVKLLLHRLLMTALGEYGPASNLLIRQYRQRKIGEYTEAKGRLWLCVLYVGHALVKPFSALPFGDAFSGMFTARHVSVALWMADRCEIWKEGRQPSIQDDVLFSRSHVLDVRGLSLTAEFRSKGQECSTEEWQEWSAETLYYYVLATGSGDSAISKLYFESWEGKCSRRNALEFCRLMETLNNDAFVVTCCPPEGNDHILSCVDLEFIVRSILSDNKKLNAKRVYGMSYV